MTRTEEYEEWYTQLKRERVLSIHAGDLCTGLESALRYRAKRDGFGLSIQCSRIEPAFRVSLFQKGQRGPGREAYLERVNSKSPAYTVIVAFSTDDGTHLWAQSKRSVTEIDAVERVLAEVERAGGQPIEYFVVPGIVRAIQAQP